jgi:hemerythrin-like metal-binding protein
MAFIEWANSLGVGVRAIDDQHRTLIGYINELAAAREAKGGKAAIEAVLSKLEAYTVEHFALEERYFDEYAYAGAAAHKKEHREFEAKVERFRGEFARGQAELTEEILVFLKTWLTTHISFMDRKYRSLFAEKGLR